jgi:hypothetical protein
MRSFAAMSPFSMRFDVALLDALRQLDLLRRGEQRVAAGLVEEHLERVCRVEAVSDREVELGLLLLLGGGPVRVQLRRQRLGLGLVEVVGEHGVGDVGRGDRPVLVAQVQERLKGFGHSRGHGDFGQRTPSVFEVNGGAGLAPRPSPMKTPCKAALFLNVRSGLTELSDSLLQDC